MSSSEPLERAQEAIDEAKQAAGRAEDTDLMAEPDDVSSADTSDDTTDAATQDGSEDDTTEDSATPEA